MPSLYVTARPRHAKALLDFAESCPNLASVNMSINSEAKGGASQYTFWMVRASSAKSCQRTDSLWLLCLKTFLRAMTLGTHWRHDWASNAKTLLLSCRSGTGGNWKKLSSLEKARVSVQCTYASVDHATEWLTRHTGQSEFLQKVWCFSLRSLRLPPTCPKIARQSCSLQPFKMVNAGRKNLLHNRQWLTFINNKNISVEPPVQSSLFILIIPPLLFLVLTNQPFGQCIDIILSKP